MNFIKFAQEYMHSLYVEILRNIALEPGKDIIDA